MATNFIAEICSNHNRDLDRALALIRAASKAGADSVKFQVFKLEELFAPEILAQSEPHRKKKDWELPFDFIPALSKEARRLKLQFGCTPFYLDAVPALKEYVDFFKVASYELLWDELLTQCAGVGKPLILSTGMATMEEVDHAVSVLRENGCRDLTLLHCVSQYPAKSGESNLSAIETMRTKFRCEVGWSDHSKSPAVIYRAIHKWQASAIEFHLDLDGSGWEAPFGHCWMPEEIGPVIKAVREGFAADGTGEKQPAVSETGERGWRADPSDGLRPMRQTRKEWQKLNA